MTNLDEIRIVHYAPVRPGYKRIRVVYHRCRYGWSAHIPNPAGGFGLPFSIPRGEVDFAQVERIVAEQLDRHRQNVQ